MFRNKTTRQHNFAMNPAPEIQRSKFPIRQTRKQAFNASELVPIMCEPVIPGDVWQHTEHTMARLATPIAPAVDDIDLETWYFFVPNRILWPNWEDFITGVNTSVTIPQIRPIDLTPSPDYVVILGGVLDHFGITPQTFTGPVFTVNVLPIWAYFTIYNEWFRDQNLETPWTWSDTWTTAGTDNIVQVSIAPWNQECLRVNKRHDYFTSSLPWPQKGSAVTLPLGSTAPVYTTAVTNDSVRIGSAPGVANTRQIDTSGAIGIFTALTGTSPTNVWADLTNATAATLNSIRLAITTQHLLEVDARGGSRYVEQLLAHFKVRSPDYRLQRPEYLGGSKIPVTVNPIAQTAAYDAEPAATESAVGNLGAEMHAGGSKRTFTYAATEHGYIIGLAAVRATPTYQQGTRRHWRLTTRLDFPWPEFVNIGEQAVATQEIYQPANNAPTNATWGYMPRYDEYRYSPNEVTGVLRSTAPQPLDWWHYAEEFASEPALNAAFIKDKTQETLARSLATAPSAQWSAQIIMDIQHDSQVARLLPTHGVPGVDKF